MSGTNAPKDFTANSQGNNLAFPYELRDLELVMNLTHCFLRYQGICSQGQRLEIMKWKMLNPWMILMPSLRKHWQVQMQWSCCLKRQDRTGSILARV